MQACNERLRSIRSNQKVMAKDVAELLGVTYRNYQRYETGEIDIPSSKLIVLANYFNVSADYLLGLCDTKERQP